MSSIPSMSQRELTDLLSELRISCDLLPASLALAEHVHGEQRRAGGGPYLEEHVYPITADVARYLFAVDPVVVVTAVLIAILHDTIEDSRDVTRATLAERFGPDIASGIATLSKPSKRDGQATGESAPSEARYVAGISSAPREVRIVKIFDRLNNLSAVHQRPSEKRRQYLAETRAHYLDLARGDDDALARRMEALVDTQEESLRD